MAVTRPNILKDATARLKYTQGVNLLKLDFPGTTTKSLGIKGPNNPISSTSDMPRTTRSPKL